MPTVEAGLLRDVADRMAVSFERATERVGSETRFFRLAGQLVAIRFAGAALVEPLTQAFSHLPVAPGAADLTIDVYDSQSTGVGPPMSAAERELLNATGMPSFQPEAGLSGSYHRLDMGLGVTDASAGRAFYWTPSLDAVPGWERGGPFKSILSGWLPGRGYRFVHAGGVGIEGKGLLVAGPSGSGKSTTALSCFAAGMEYLGDDYCAVSRSELRAYSLYRSVKLEVGHMADTVGLGPSIHRGVEYDDKGVYFPALPHGGPMVSSLEVQAIILPRVTGAAGPTLRPASAVEALTTIAPSTLLQLSGSSAETMADLAKLCREVPAYRLELGGGMDLLAPMLAELLR